MTLYSKKDAFLLGRKETIDLKYINAKEYVDKIEGKSSKFYLIKNYMKNTLAICGIIWFILVVLFGWDILTPQKANANAGDENLAFLSRFPDTEKVVIGCYNDRTQKARPGSKCTQGGDHNIVLPPKTHIEKWLKVFNPYETTNRLALINFESNFRENASNSHAKGYVQTLRKWNIPNDIVSQLTWVKNRQVEQKKIYSGKSKRCGYFWENNNEKDGFTLGEYGVLSCLYRYHYHATKGTAYAKRGIEATLYYKWYMFPQDGKDWETYREETYQEIIFK